MSSALKQLQLVDVAQKQRAAGGIQRPGLRGRVALLGTAARQPGDPQLGCAQVLLSLQESGELIATQQCAVAAARVLKMPLGCDKICQEDLLAVAAQQLLGLFDEIELSHMAALCGQVRSDAHRVVGHRTGSPFGVPAVGLGHVMKISGWTLLYAP